MSIDIVTVVHNATNTAQAVDLEKAIAAHEDNEFQFVVVDNSTENRGFAKACNWGALHPDVRSPIIGFLNPDVVVNGPFIDAVRAALEDPNVVITGCRFGKPARELAIWGVQDWVCGAAFFVKRSFFAPRHGFDEQFVWAWEETDLIRQAEHEGLRVRSIQLPLEHASPSGDSSQDIIYKRRNFELGAQRFEAKWRKPPQIRTPGRRGRRG